MISYLISRLSLDSIFSACESLSGREEGTLQARQLLATPGLNFQQPPVHRLFPCWYTLSNLLRPHMCDCTVIPSLSVSQLGNLDYIQTTDRAIPRFIPDGCEWDLNRAFRVPLLLSLGLRDSHRDGRRLRIGTNHSETVGKGVTSQEQVGGGTHLSIITQTSFR